MSTQKEYLANLHTELDFYKRQLASIKKHFKDNTKGDVDNISDSLHHLWNEAKKSYTQLESASKNEWEPLKKHSAEAFSQLRSSFDDFVHDSSDHAQAYMAEFKKYSAKRIEDLGEYIKENPFRSVFIAAAVGFVAAKILK